MATSTGLVTTCTTEWPSDVADRSKSISEHLPCFHRLELGQGVYFTDPHTQDPGATGHHGAEVGPKGVRGQEPVRRGFVIDAVARALEGNVGGHKVPGPKNGWRLKWFRSRGERQGQGKGQHER